MTRAASRVGCVIGASREQFSHYPLQTSKRILVIESDGD